MCYILTKYCIGGTQNRPQGDLVGPPSSEKAPEIPENPFGKTKQKVYFKKSDCKILLYKCHPQKE